jgi:hypothetical protein
VFQARNEVYEHSSDLSEEIMRTLGSNPFQFRIIMMMCISVTADDTSESISLDPVRE